MDENLIYDRREVPEGEGESGLRRTVKVGSEK